MLRSGMMIVLVGGALALVGCSREPSKDAIEVEASTATESSAVAGNITAGSAPSPAAVECLAADILAGTQGVHEILKQQRESVGAKIPASELVYWGRTKTHNPVTEARCEGPQDSAVQAEVVGNPFGVFNAVTSSRHAAAVTYQAAPKGDFEKTADHEARISREKAEFEKTNAGKKIDNYEIDYVWMSLFGSPRLKDDGLREEQLYNPDTETLSLTIVPQASYRDESLPRSQTTLQYPFEIPVRIRLTPEQAQKFFQEYPIAHLMNLRPAIAMQMQGAVLTVREISLKDEYPDKFQRLGFGLDNLVMNVELSRDFLPAR